jgi:hypothetical protein
VQFSGRVRAVLVTEYVWSAWHRLSPLRDVRCHGGGVAISACAIIVITPLLKISTSHLHRGQHSTCFYAAVNPNRLQSAAYIARILDWAKPRTEVYFLRCLVQYVYMAKLLRIVFLPGTPPFSCSHFPLFSCQQKTTSLPIFFEDPSYSDSPLRLEALLAHLIISGRDGSCIDNRCALTCRIRSR